MLFTTRPLKRTRSSVVRRLPSSKETHRSVGEVNVAGGLGEITRLLEALARATADVIVDNVFLLRIGISL